MLKSSALPQPDASCAVGAPTPEPQRGATFPPIGRHFSKAPTGPNTATHGGRVSEAPTGRNISSPWQRHGTCIAQNPSSPEGAAQLALKITFNQHRMPRVPQRIQRRIPVAHKTIGGFTTHPCAVSGPVPQRAVHPPSMGSAAPVIEQASSPQRNTTNAAISSISTNRLLGCAARMTSRITRSRGS